MDIYSPTATVVFHYYCEPGQRMSAVRAVPPRAVLKSLDNSTVRAFILQSLLQTYDSADARQEKVVLDLQRSCAKKWSLPARLLDASSSTAMLRQLGQYALGERRLELSALRVLDETFSALGHGKLSESPLEALKLLEKVRYLQPGDNLRRIVSAVRMILPEEVHACVSGHVDPVDIYDQLRVKTPHNVYAIDSATTSEVDDAIGIHLDQHGTEWITVHISDATTYCPYDSDLEQRSARLLTTTTYLPEGVYFMLPKPIIEAATLHPDRPCRSFDIRFRMDEASGSVYDYSVGVGWCNNVRRITYDELQDLYTKGPNQCAPLPSTPTWASAADIATLHRILYYAKIRAAAREKRGNGVSTNLPEPLVKVKGTTVEYVKDQILCTKDARIAVAELMIAANEVCARIAEEIKQPIPFRGSRPLSSVHEAAMEYEPPRGMIQIASSDTRVLSLAQSIYDDYSLLSGVSRAIYHHQPLLHNGLDMLHYCHATSPLRRYPDMLVHHQLKVSVGRKHGLRTDEFIPDFQMAELCASSSKQQKNARVMQKKSVRFWVLTYLQQVVLRANRDAVLKCLVGYTYYVGSCAEYRSARKTDYVSEIYIGELQITHSICHSIPGITPGMSLICKVKELIPLLDVFELEIVEAVKSSSISAETFSGVASPDN